MDVGKAILNDPLTEAEKEIYEKYGLKGTLKDESSERWVVIRQNEEIIRLLRKIAKRAANKSPRQIDSHE